MRPLLHDLRYACRTLARAPLFTAVVVLTLALGIGANSAIFSIVHAVLLGGMPFDHPDRLVQLQPYTDQGYHTSLSLPNYHDWQRDARSFSSIAATAASGFNLTVRGGTEHVEATVMIGDLFGTLGLHPYIGHTPRASETERGAAATAVLSYGFWQRQFGGSASVIGRTITLDARPFTIIGVAPPALRYPEPRTDVYVPLGALPDYPWDGREATFGLTAVARLEPGATVATAQADMDRVMRVIQHATGYAGSTRVQSLRDSIVGGVQPALVALSGAVGLVLLIACANIGGLVMARGESRQRELAVRSALGASTTTLVRQLFTETFVLAAAGGAAGLGVAALGVHLFGQALPARLPVIPPTHLSTPVLAFTGALTLGTALLFGLSPALRASRARGMGVALVSGSARTGDARRSVRFRGALITAQIALSLVLLVSAALILRTVAAMRSVDPGFDAHNVITMRIAPNNDAYADPARWIGLYRDIVDRTRALPDVRSVGLLNAVPLFSGSYDAEVLAEGQPDTPGNREAALSLNASPDLFRTMGIQLVRGRPFTDADTRTSTPVAIIDQTMAEKLWPNENPIGRRVQLDPPVGGAPQWREVVGVVRNIHYYRLERAARITAYRPVTQAAYDGAPNFFLFVKTRGDAQALSARIRQVVTTADAGTAVYYVQTMDDVVNQYLATVHLLEQLLGIFAGLALMLAALGAYGLIAYTVARRTRELGIRMALGATSAQAARLVMRRGFAMTGVGIGAGLVGAAFASRALGASLFGVKALDPAVYIAASACLAGVALAACWIPARRVTRIPPGIALRAE